MEVETVTTFFALLAVLGILFLVALLVAAIVFKIRGGVPESLQRERQAWGPTSLILGFAVALVCMLGSLYLSEIAKFPPCIFCWYQRIAMYPMVLLMGIAALRKDTSIKWYTVPLGLIGVSISIYHYLVERFPDSVKSACTNDVPCSAVWVWKFHFLSIPAMAGIGFLLIIALSLMATPPSSSSDEGHFVDEPQTVGANDE